MPTTSTFRALQSRRIDWSSGISWRHGAHQVAQKVIIKDLPRQVAIEVGAPVRSPSENSGRRSGIFRALAPPSAAPPSATPPGATPAGAVESASLGSGGLASPAGTRTPPVGPAGDVERPGP